MRHLSRQFSASSLARTEGAVAFNGSGRNGDVNGGSNLTGGGGQGQEGGASSRLSAVSPGSR